MLKKIVIVCLTYLLLSGISAFAGAPSTSASRFITTSAKTWAYTYVGYSAKLGYAPHAQLNMPLVWLYNPAGQAIGFFMKSQIPALKRLMRKFPYSLKGKKPLEQEPDFDAMNQILIKASGGKIHMHSAGSQWTAALIVEVPINTCPECEQALRLLHNVKKQSNGRLQLVTFAIIIPSGQ
jgi:hypothetical protein